MAMTTLPATSSAVNIQIIEPKNFPGGAVPGQINNGNPYALANGQNNTFNNLGPAGQGGFNQGGFGQNNAFNNAAFGQGNGFQGAPVNPYAAPQQQLQQAYQNAEQARFAAEQARNNYYNLANQLNTAAYQQAATSPYQYPQYNIYSQGYPQGYQQQQPYQQQGYQQQAQPYNQPINQPYMPVTPPYFPQPNQQPYAQQYPYPYYNQQQQQPFQPQVPNANQLPPDQQQAQQPQPVEQPPVEPEPVQPEPVQPQGPDYTTMPLAELNARLAQPESIQEKVNVIEQVAMRGQATPETFQLLEQEALLDTSTLDPAMREQADYVRETAIWSLGLLNQKQNAQLPAKELPGLNTFQQIANSKSDSEKVKAAVAQALGIMGRENERPVKKILKKLAKNKNSVSGAIAKDIMNGKGLQLQGL